VEGTREASVARTEIWRLHWQAFLDSPLFGYGLGGAETVSKSLLNLSNFDVLWNIKAILNVYLQWLEEAGVVEVAARRLVDAVADAHAVSFQASGACQRPVPGERGVSTPRGGRTRALTRPARRGWLLPWS